MSQKNEPNKQIDYTLEIRGNGEIRPKFGVQSHKQYEFNHKRLEDIYSPLRRLNEKRFEDREDFKEFGRFLYEALFDDHSFHTVWQPLSEQSDTTLRIRLVFEKSIKQPTDFIEKVINLPWEFLYYPDGKTFLGTDPRITISCEYQDWTTKPGYAINELPLRILFVYAQPDDLEVGFIESVRDELTALSDLVTLLPNPTIDELREAFLHKPHVFHFLGHGTLGKLILKDVKDGTPLFYDGESLADLVRGANIKLAVLQACEGAAPLSDLSFSGTAAWLVQQGIPAVVAMRYPISQALAWRFIQEFYTTLADGQSSIDKAVQRGRNVLSSIVEHANRDFGTPVLWTRLENGKLFHSLKNNGARLPLQAQLPKLMPLIGNINLKDNELKNIAYECVPLKLHSALQNCHEKDMLVCLLECLAQMGQFSSGRMPLLDFVARLSRLVPMHQAQIRAWINTVAENEGLTQAQREELLQNQPLEPIAPASLPPYLLIELAPTEDSKYYAVHAWLFMCSENIKKLYVKNKTMLDDMPARIEEIFQILDDFNVNHNELTIEFILPRDLLCHHIEHWTDEYGDPLGIRYRVVVRSRERLRHKKLQRFWCPCWKTADKKAAFQQVAETYAEWVDERQLRQLRSKVDKGTVCFALTFVPQIAIDLKKDFLFALIKVGAPIAIWPRQFNNVDELKQQLSTLLSCEPLEQLPQFILKTRRELWEINHEQHTGYHLSLFWDDPDRRPLDTPTLRAPTE